MNTNKIRNYTLLSIIFTFILGTLLHFTYEWSGENIIVAAFSAVNESIWEHLKLLYFPMLLTLIIGYFYIGKSTPNFICSKVIGILSSILFTIAFFYIYSGILGKYIAIVDIILFFVATIFGEFLSYILIKNNFKCNNKIYLTLLILLGICFVFFTYSAPNIGIFRDPITGETGIKYI